MFHNKSSQFYSGSSRIKMTNLPPASSIMICATSNTGCQTRQDVVAVSQDGYLSVFVFLVTLHIQLSMIKTPGCVLLPPVLLSMNPSIHPSIIYTRLVLFRVTGICWSQLSSGERQGSTLDRSPVHHRASRPPMQT